MEEKASAWSDDTSFAVSVITMKFLIIEYHAGWLNAKWIHEYIYLILIWWVAPLLIIREKFLRRIESIYIKYAN